MESSCPICFEDLGEKIKASPDTCGHIFCLSCLEKWSKLGSFCPVDRKRYKKIINLESDSHIQIKPRKRKRIKTVYDFTSKCEICSDDSHADVLLLCDCCDLAFHLYCLTPSLKKIPSGLWFCPTCTTVEKKLKKKNGITKEVEAELGNAVNHIKKGKTRSDVQKIITTGRSCSSGKELINKEKKQNSDEIKKIESHNDALSTTIVEACSNVASEFKDINIESDFSEHVFRYSFNLNDSDEKFDKIFKTFDFDTKKCNSECLKSTKTYDSRCKKKQIGILKIPTQDETYKALTTSSKNTNIDDLCLNNASKDVSLLDDCLFEAVSFGEMKIGIDEDCRKNVCKTRINSYINKDEKNEKSQSYIKHEHSKEYRKSSSISHHRGKNFNISSSNKDIHHEIEFISNESGLQKFCQNNKISEKKKMERNEKGTLNEQDILPSCSFMPVESCKGTFNNLISHVSVENYFKRPSNEIIENKSSKEQPKEKLQFSVFERIEGNDASQKKYSEINSFARILFSSNLNVKHCLSCKDMILAVSRNYCKICKLKYSKKSLMNGKDSAYTKNSSASQTFESLVNTNMDSKSIDKQKSMSKKWKNILEKRRCSLLCKLQKIHNSKQKSVEHKK